MCGVSGKSEVESCWLDLNLVNFNDRRSVDMVKRIRKLTRLMTYGGVRLDE